MAKKQPKESSVLDDIQKASDAAFYNLTRGVEMVANELLFAFSPIHQENVKEEEEEALKDAERKAAEMARLKSKKMKKKRMHTIDEDPMENAPPSENGSKDKHDVKAEPKTTLPTSSVLDAVVAENTSFAVDSEDMETISTLSSGAPSKCQAIFRPQPFPLPKEPERYKYLVAEELLRAAAEQNLKRPVIERKPLLESYGSSEENEVPDDQLQSDAKGGVDPTKKSQPRVRFGLEPFGKRSDKNDPDAPTLGTLPEKSTKEEKPLHQVEPDHGTAKDVTKVVQTNVEEPPKIEVLVDQIATKRPAAAASSEINAREEAKKLTHSPHSPGSTQKANPQETKNLQVGPSDAVSTQTGTSRRAELEKRIMQELECLRKLIPKESTRREDMEKRLNRELQGLRKNVHSDSGKKNEADHKVDKDSARTAYMEYKLHQEMHDLEQTVSHGEDKKERESKRAQELKDLISRLERVSARHEQIRLRDKKKVEESSLETRSDFSEEISQHLTRADRRREDEGSRQGGDDNGSKASNISASTPKSIRSLSFIHSMKDRLEKIQKEQRESSMESRNETKHVPQPEVIDLSSYETLNDTAEFENPEIIDLSDFVDLSNV